MTKASIDNQTQRSFNEFSCFDKFIGDLFIYKFIVIKADDLTIFNGDSIKSFHEQLMQDIKC